MSFKSINLSKTSILSLQTFEIWKQARHIWKMSSQLWHCSVTGLQDVSHICLEAFWKCTGSVYSNQSNLTQKSLPQSLLGQCTAHAPPGSQFTSPPPSSHSQDCLLWIRTRFPKGLLHWTAPWLIRSKANEVVVDTTVLFILFFMSLFFFEKHWKFLLMPKADMTKPFSLSWPVTNPWAHRG